jgi:hypothetical protein
VLGEFCCVLTDHIQAGVYILENTPPGEYQPMSSGGKNMKKRAEKKGKIQDKKKEGEGKRKEEK